jgi:hypothetical protein
MASQPWRVVENRPRGRTVHEGTEKTARAYVEQNYPRTHVDPGNVADHPVADVHVVDPDGARTHYLGAENDDPWADVPEGDE